MKLNQERTGQIKSAKFYQSHGVDHIRSIQGVETLEEYQIKKIIEPIYKYDRVAIRACHDVGKTWTVARVVLALGSSFPGAKIITTAPSWTQVEKLLWSEIRTGYRRSKQFLGGRMLNTEWKFDDPDWFALGISPKDEGVGDGGQGATSNFQGFHGDLVVIVFDEATGVSHKRWLQAEGMMTSKHVKFIAIGNPTSKASAFFQCFKDPAWHKVHISCFDSPNLIANGFLDLGCIEYELEQLRHMTDVDAQARMSAYKTVKPHLLSAKWVIALALKRGVDHPLFQGKALGEFPDEDDHVIIPLSRVEESQRREYAPQDTDPRYYGLDLARFGSDDSVLTTIDQWKCQPPLSFSRRDGPEICGEVIHHINSLPRRRKEILCVDGTGLGGPIIDFLREKQRDGALPKHIQIIEINNGEKPDHNIDLEQDRLRKHYANKKAQMFDYLGDDMKENLCLPNESVYLEELPGIRYTFTSSGAMQIESKDAFKTRTGLGSPDKSDSLALANFGRHVSSNVGSFAEMVKNSRPSRGTIARGLKSGDQW